MALQSVESRLASALFAHLNSIILAPQLPIVWPGIVYPPTGQQKAPAYIRVHFSPNDPERRFIGSDDPHRFSGFLNLSLCTTLVGGAIGPAETAGMIAEHFEVDDELTFDGLTLRITKRAYVADGYPDAEEQRWRTPIIVPFEAWQ